MTHHGVGRHAEKNVKLSFGKKPKAESERCEFET